MAAERCYGGLSQDGTLQHCSSAVATDCCVKLSGTVE